MRSVLVASTCFYLCSYSLTRKPILRWCRGYPPWPAWLLCECACVRLACILLRGRGPSRLPRFSFPFPSSGTTRMHQNPLCAVEVIYSCQHIYVQSTEGVLLTHHRAITHYMPQSVQVLHSLYVVLFFLLLHVSVNYFSRFLSIFLSLSLFIFLDTFLSLSLSLCGLFVAFINGSWTIFVFIKVCPKCPLPITSCFHFCD